MPDGHRIPQNAQDYIRSLERRITALERQPSVRTAQEILGNGIAPMARHIIDWNDKGVLYDGWYYSDVTTLNSPNPTKAWIGMTISAYPGLGMQSVWAMMEGEPMTHYIRQFNRNGSGAATFGTWTLD